MITTSENALQILRHLESKKECDLYWELIVSYTDTFGLAVSLLLGPGTRLPMESFHTII